MSVRQLFNLAGKTALLSGFGVGLSWASTVMRFSEGGGR